MKDMFNIEVTDVNIPILAKFASLEKEQSVRKIQVVPKTENVKVRVLRPEGIITEGYGEKLLTKLKTGTIVQFERYGFVRLLEISPQDVFGYFIND